MNTKLSPDTYNFPVLYCISERPLETCVGTCDTMQQQKAYIKSKRISRLFRIETDAFA